MADLDDDERSGRTWTLLAALAVVVIIVAVGGWLVISGNDDDDPDDSTAATGGSAPSDYIGPRAIEGGVPVGFAHTPAGSQAAAAAWASYGALSPASRLPDGIEEVFASPDVLGTDPEIDTWLSMSPVAVSAGVGGDAGVVRVLLVKTQEAEDESGVVVGSLLSVAVSLEWSEDQADWRVTQLEILEDFVPPMAREDFEGFFWLAPISYQTAGPLFSP